MFSFPRHVFENLENAKCVMRLFQQRRIILLQRRETCCAFKQDAIVQKQSKIWKLKCYSFHPDIVNLVALQETCRRIK